MLHTSATELFRTINSWTALVQCGGIMSLWAANAIPLSHAAESNSSIRRVRAVGEAEVVSEFLKNEFYHSDFDPIRRDHTDLVLRPDLENPKENELRRQLLFRKRAGLWRELPADTQWYELKIGRHELDQIRIFPRADWRRYAQDGFALSKIAARIRAAMDNSSDDPFLARIRSMAVAMRTGAIAGSVLLIGTQDSEPLTIIEGNHRMAAAMVAGADATSRLRFLCGFSHNMGRCCWYRTSLTSLLHYAGNLLRDWSELRHSDVARLMARRKLPASAQSIGGDIVIDASNPK